MIEYALWHKESITNNVVDKFRNTEKLSLPQIALEFPFLGKKAEDLSRDDVAKLLEHYEALVKQIQSKS